MRGAGTVGYVISCRRLGLLKIGVAEDAGKRLRELQVGSPVELTLADTRPYAERADAVAVSARSCIAASPRGVHAAAGIG